MNHFRIALYDMKSGTADEATEIARTGMIPLYKSMPGFVRYEVGKLDSGGIASFSIWETEEEAEAAVAAAAGWVAEHLAHRIELRENHVGELFWDE
jgi:hypothetical protein